MSEDNNQEPPIYNQSVHIEGDMHGDVIVYVNAAEKAAPPARPVLKPDPDRCIDYWKGVATTQTSRAIRNREIGIKAAGLTFVGGVLTGLWLCCNTCDKTSAELSSDWVDTLPGLSEDAPMPSLPLPFPLSPLDPYGVPPLPSPVLPPLLPPLPLPEFQIPDAPGDNIVPDMAPEFYDEHHMPPVSQSLLTGNECVWSLDFSMIDFPVFDGNSSTLNPAQETCLRELADVASSEYVLGTLTMLVIGGYTDPQGSRADNIDLSRDRALAVKEFLKAELETWNAGDMPLIIAPHGETRLIGDYSDNVIDHDAEPRPEEIDERDRRFTIGRIDLPEHDASNRISGIYPNLNPEI